MIAAVRVRGIARVRKTIGDTMLLLKLKSVNNCVLLPEDAVTKGMLMKSKDYITWGQVNKETLTKLLQKRAKLTGDKTVTSEYLETKKYTFEKLTDDLIANKIKLKDLGIKQTIRLHPPRKGYEAIKRPFTMKGSLGNRGDKINILLEKMM